MNERELTKAEKIDEQGRNIFEVARERYFEKFKKIWAEYKSTVEEYEAARYEAIDKYGLSEDTLETCGDLVINVVAENNTELAELLLEIAGSLEGVIS